ncbi:hypothetical protein BD410DRAFT_615157, partial [Rickenella mellea]
NLESAKHDPNEVLPVSSEKAKADGQEAVKHLRTLLSLVLTNAEARKLLGDFSIIGRDILARGAVHAAEGIRPDQERLQHIDQSAPKDTFITEGGRQAGPNETPVLEAKVPGTDTRVTQHPRDDVGYGAKIKTGDGNTYTGDEARQRAVNGGADAAKQAVDTTRAHGQDVRGNVDAAETDEEKKEVAKAGFKDKIMGFRDNLLDRVPQEHKDLANDKYEHSKRVIADEYFPEERRDQFIFRGKKVIVECQKHDDYQQSIRWLLGFFENYASHGKHVAGKGQESHQALTEDPALNTALSELRTLLERFANGQSLQVVID